MVFGFSKFKNKDQNSKQPNQEVSEPIEAQENIKTSWLGRLKKSLSRTRTEIAQGIGALFLGKKEIDEESLEILESALLTADVGTAVAEKLLATVTKLIDRNELNQLESLQIVLRQELKNILKPCEKPLIITQQKPFVILMVGVNGVGKTTTIAKLAHYYQMQGKRIMLAAGDTYRAAAIEQLKTWGERNRVAVIAQQLGADSASVTYDAMQAASAREIDILIADTAGRLHTQAHLMAELSKIKRVINKQNAAAPHEVMIVIDATTGQNALRQVEMFNEVVAVTGITVTKLDGTAKAGILFAIAEKTQIPIRFVGIGEQMEDLKPFETDEFVEALI